MLWWNDGARVWTGLDYSLLTSDPRRCCRHMRSSGKDEEEQRDASEAIYFDNAGFGHVSILCERHPFHQGPVWTDIYRMKVCRGRMISGCISSSVSLK